MTAMYASLLRLKVLHSQIKRNIDKSVVSKLRRTVHTQENILFGRIIFSIRFQASFLRFWDSLRAIPCNIILTDDRHHSLLWN